MENQQSTPATPPLTQAPQQPDTQLPSAEIPEKKQIKSKKWLVILLITLLLAILVFSALFIFYYQSKQKKMNAESRQTSDEKGYTSQNQDEVSQVQSNRTGFKPDELPETITCTNVDEFLTPLQITKEYKRTLIFPVETDIRDVIAFKNNDIFIQKFLWGVVYPKQTTSGPEKELNIPFKLPNYLSRIISSAHYLRGYTGRTLYFGPIKHVNTTLIEKFYWDPTTFSSIVGINSEWYALSQYNSRSSTVFQKLYKFDNKGKNFQEISIPSKYRPIPTEWNIAQERGLNNENSFLEGILGTYEESIYFKDNKTSKIVSYNVIKKVWSEHESLPERFRELKTLRSILKKDSCIYYQMQYGDAIIVRDFHIGQKSMFKDQYPINLYIDKEVELTE